MQYVSFENEFYGLFSKNMLTNARPKYDILGFSGGGLLTCIHDSIKYGTLSNTLICDG